MKGCGGCGSALLQRILELRTFDGHPAWLGRCPVCALVQAGERPSNDELEHYYSRYVYAGDSAWNVSEATLASLERLTLSLDRYRQSNRCLDVGCGVGGILSAMTRHGWEAEGTELSGVAADRLEDRGFHIHRGAIETLELPATTYDVILLSEVVEHLREPRAALANVVQALRPGGVVYLTTPNFQSLSRRILGVRWRIIAVPEHLFYFSTGSLRALLSSVGLLPTRVWTEGLNPYELVACLRQSARQVASAARGAQAHEAGEALRLSAVRKPWMRATKFVVNLGLRVTELGDTLKCLATRA